MNRSSRYAHDQEELERFKREINLTEFAAARGYRIDRRQSSQSSVTMRHQGTDDKIVISRRDADQHWIYFSVREYSDNGSIVDFVQRRDRISLAGVRKELRAWSASTRPSVHRDDYVPTLVSVERDRERVQRTFIAARIASNSPYLNSRGIRPETLTSTRFRDTWRVDARGNVLFPHADDVGVCGFESKNVRWTSFASGGQKALWTSQRDPADKRLVIAESAIDALSHYQLRPDPSARYASTAGKLGDAQLEILRREIAALPTGSTLVLAFDADQAGDDLASTVTGVAGDVIVERSRAPRGKDWNDSLKLQERAYIESFSQRRSPGIDRGSR